MKALSLSRGLTALALLVACLLGCSRFDADAPKPEVNTVSSSNTPAHGELAAADISGKYDVAGTNENGSPYKGALEVIKRGEVYQFRWTAGKQYDGVGITMGNVVAVAFTEGSDGKGCGVVSYRIENDGALDGKWGYWGMDDSGVEKATRSRGSGLAGDYATAGTNPDGKEYKGALTVAAKGGGYEFAWNNGSTGFGIQRGNNVSVGVGGAKCAFVAYQVKSDGSLDGVWGGYGSQETGTEIAKKN